MGVEENGAAKLSKGSFTNLLLQTAERKKVIPFVGPSTQGPTSWPLCLRVGPSAHRAKSEYEFCEGGASYFAQSHPQNVI